MEDLYKYVKELYEKGLNYIGGVDEVGRGPLIGSVVAVVVDTAAAIDIPRSVRIARVRG